MDYLKDFDYAIYMYDGMLTETGGWFGREHCNDYICKCLDTADIHLKNGGTRAELIETVDKYIRVYEKETDWELNDLELDFLRKLKGLVAKI